MLQNKTCMVFMDRAFNLWLVKFKNGEKTTLNGSRPSPTNLRYSSSPKVS